MLLLIDSDGNDIGAVKKNNRSHKSRIGEKTCVYILRILCALFLELSHSGKLAEHGVAVKYPPKLCVLGNVRLNEEGIFRFVQTASEVKRQRFIGSFAKLSRDLSYRYGVKVNYAVKRFIFIGKS